MVYLFAALGFIFGFSVGLGLINVILRRRSIRDIQKDTRSKWLYGSAVWIFAFAGLFLGTYLHAVFWSS